jgi:UDP-N-acetylmuramate dehydrogenase
MRVETVGVDLIEETDEFVRLNIASGEVWDDVVRFAVEQSWWGIENLSHIPGFAGGLAYQNVGAYGQEASTVIETVEVLDTTDLQIKTFTNAECGFHYRKSIFNTTQRDRYIILHITLKLQKNAQPVLSYGDLKKYFVEHNIAVPTIMQIRQAIIDIRDRKYPFPNTAVGGNAGSFFRGPILSEDEIKKLVANIKDKFVDAAGEKLAQMEDRLRTKQGFKTPAAFLIELCGMNTYQVGGAKVNEKQPAIILNSTGKATSAEVLQVFTTVAHEVYQKTSCLFHIEPSLIGFAAEEQKQVFDQITAP